MAGNWLSWCSYLKRFYWLHHLTTHAAPNRNATHTTHTDYAYIENIERDILGAKCIICNIIEFSKILLLFVLCDKNDENIYKNGNYYIIHSGHAWVTVDITSISRRCEEHIWTVGLSNLDIGQHTPYHTVLVSTIYNMPMRVAHMHCIACSSSALPVENNEPLVIAPFRFYGLIGVITWPNGHTMADARYAPVPGSRGRGHSH